MDDNDVPTKQPGRIARAFSLCGLFVKLSWNRYRSLNVKGKLLLWSLILFYISLAAFILVVGLDKIAQTMYDLAQKISHYPFGWLILLVGIILISFPPLIGHTTSVTLCGFAYGMKGFPLAAAGSYLGSGLAFIVLRLLFGKRLRKWSAQNDKWQALEAVIRAKGLPLIILIRASPFPPWVYATSLFASIQTVALWQFVIATTAVLPRVALHTFIGSRLASLSDGETRRQMDTATKIMNTSLVVGGLLVAILSSLIIYRSMEQHLRHLKGISPEIDELAAEAIEEAVGEGAPLLGPGNYSADTLDLSEEEEDTIRAPRSRPTSPDV